MKFLKIICVLMLALGLTCYAFAEEAKRIAKVANTTGRVNVKMAGEIKWTRAKTGMILSEGDVLKTGRRSKAILSINGRGETANIEVAENSQLGFSELIKDKRTRTQKTMLDLAIGEVLIKAEKLHTPESRFEIKTPTSIVGVRGTKFSVKVEALD